MSMGHFNTPGMPVMTAYQRTVSNCKRLIEAEQYDSAVALLEELRQQQPRDVNVLRMLGHSLMMIDSRELSIRHLLFASKLEPANVELHIDLASAHRRLDQMRKAHQAVDTALKLNPAHPRAVMIKARLLQAHGNSEQAYQIVRQALEIRENPEVLSVFGQLCRELKRQGEAIDKLRAAIGNPSLDRNVRQDLLFVLGHLLDSVGEYDEAFDCFVKGNSMSAMQTQLDQSKWAQNWTREKYDALPTSDVDGSRCVFIVGMPRSGTTLTEQIIASHPEADGIGEGAMIDKYARNKMLEDIDQDYMNRAGRAYVEMLSAQFPDRSVRRVCDKMPENYYFAGFITKALPGSKIIHCKRNPIDTCLSIYFQRFGPRLVYATDLSNCADQYLSYLKAMAHLRDVLGIEMLEAQYEQTTARPEESIRAMLDHVGLPFDEACMSFHKSKKSVHTASVSQIRQPLYTSSSERWKNYEKHLSPLLDKLGHLLEK